VTSKCSGTLYQKT